jgi:integrase
VATITKTPSRTWKAIIRKRGWPITIKTFRTKRDAQDWARRIEDDMVRGAYIDRAPSENTTLKAALTRYLAEISPTKSPGSPRRETIRAKPLFDQLGDYAIVAITPDLVAKYRDDRLALGKSNNTVRLELALLSHLFTVAIKEWRMGLVYNPVAAVRKPSAGTGRNRRLLPEEERTLLTACDEASNPMLGWMVRLAISTGMRAGEIQSMCRGQVDLTKRVVRLSKTKNGTARTIPLTRLAVQVLQEALAHPIRPLNTELVFWGEPGRDGQRRPYEYNPAWRRALKRAGITDLRFHDLRHEAVSRLVEAGLGDQEVAAISGHKSMQMLKRYTHLRAEDLVDRLDQLVGQ